MIFRFYNWLLKRIRTAFVYFTLADWMFGEGRLMYGWVFGLRWLPSRLRTKPEKIIKNDPSQLGNKRPNLQYIYNINSSNILRCRNEIVFDKDSILLLVYHLRDWKSESESNKTHHLLSLRLTGYFQKYIKRAKIVLFLQNIILSKFITKGMSF